MKQICSLKFKISIGLACFLIFLSVLASAVLLLDYQNILDGRSEENLIDAVETVVSDLEENQRMVNLLISGDEVLLDNTWLYKNDVTLSYYSMDGERLNGIFPLDKAEEPVFTEGRIVDVMLEEEQCFSYDRLVTSNKGGIWVRGIAFSDAPLTYMIYELRDVFILIPVLVVLALLGGYFLTGRFLVPVDNMRKTADKIRISGTLNCRIPIPKRQDELYQLANSFNQMFDCIEKQMETEKQFSSNASHELRTPVAVILAECDYALENAETVAQLQETAANIQQQGYRMNRLIEELLIFTRIQQGSEKYPKQQMNLSSILSPVLEDFRYIDDKNITLSCELDDKICLEVNESLFSLLFRNLLQNAYKYSRENGCISVKLYQDDAQIVLQVKDNGIGINHEDLPHIWERFYRSDEVRDREGTGLGLSLVKEIAEYHHGQVSVVSASEKGSMFQIVFTL